MAALFPKHKPTSQHAILHVLSQPNPQRKGAAEWTVAQLRPRLTELCGTPCPNKNVGMTLRSKLEPKGLVVSHKVANVRIWAATSKARRSRLFFASLACAFLPESPRRARAKRRSFSSSQTTRRVQTACFASCPR